MKILITGCHGYMATHLARKIRTLFPFAIIVGTSRSGAASDYLDNVYRCDHSIKEDNMKLFVQFNPDVVFHLAAQSYVSSSWEDPASTYQTNILGTEYLVDAIFQKLSDRIPRLIFASSSEVYHYSSGKLISEDFTLSPRSPYGISKLACEHILMNYFVNLPNKLTILRLFNHSGPGRPPIFIDTKTAYLIAKAEMLGQSLNLDFRTLSATRDFLDYRDVVSAYIECITSTSLSGIYNVCSSSPLTLNQLVSTYILKSKLSITLTESCNESKHSDGGFLVGDNAKLNRATQWEPRYNYLMDTTGLIMDYARKSMQYLS